MTRMKRIGILGLTCLLGLTAVTVAAGQRGDRRDRDERRWGADSMPQAGVCFYEDIGFRGRYFCVDTREALGRLPQAMRDKISSLRIIGQVDVVVFRNERFKGNVSGLMNPTLAA